MKLDKVFIIVVFSIFLSSCYSVYQVKSNLYNYSDSITFSINKVEEGQVISTGSGSYHASRGYKFVFIYMTFENLIEEKQELNFDNIELLNPKDKTKYKVEWSMVTGPINIWGKVDSYIRKGDKKTRKLVFTFPKEEKAKYLKVNSNLVEIDYSK